MFFYWAMATFLSFIIKGLAGFANSMFFGTILGFKTDNINISPVDLMLSLPSNSILMWKGRKHLIPKIWVPVALLTICGSLVGVFFLKVGDSQIVKIIFGIIVFLIGIEMFFRERKPQKQKASKIVLACLGILSGVCSGLYGIGALLAAYVGRITKNVDEFRANMAIVFLTESCFRIFFYRASGILTLEVVKTSICVIPFMLLGMMLGGFIAKKTSEKAVKNIVIILLCLSGLSLVITNLIIIL